MWNVPVFEHQNKVGKTGPEGSWMFLPTKPRKSPIKSYGVGGLIILEKRSCEGKTSTLD